MAKNNSQKNLKKEDEGEILDDVLSDEEQTVSQTLEETLDDKTEDADKIEVDEEEKPAETTEEPTKTETDAEIKTEDVTKTEVEEPAPAPPPKPARPLTPRQEAAKSLQEAFPTVEEKYIHSHLIAANYHLEQAFNALLYLSDPDSVSLDEVAPVAPVVTEAPAPALPQRRELSQLEQDELLAKRLDEEYRHKAERRARRDPARRRQQQQQQPTQQEDDESDSDVFGNFVDKDLPQIKEQFSKNIEETKNKLNSWIGGWKKQYNSSQQDLQNRQIKKKVRDEFEQDPEEVDLQKFHGIKLSDDTDDFGVPTEKKTGGRSRAQSTDLYGTPKHKETKEVAPEPKDKKKGISMADDDDFSLSE